MLRADGILKVNGGKDRYPGLDRPADKGPARIVLLLEELNFGGAQRQALELALNLSPVRFQAEIWTMAAGDDMASFAEKGRIPVVHLSKRTWVGPDSLLNLWRRLRSARIDILLLMTVVPNIWGRLLGRLARVPIIIGACRGVSSAFRQHETLLWPLVDHHICNAIAQKRQLCNRRRVPEPSVTVIPNGVNTEFFKPPATASGADRQIILCIARLVPEKDHHTLITAFGLLAPRHPEAELWIVGDGKQAQIHLRICRTGALRRTYPPDAGAIGYPPPVVAGQRARFELTGGRASECGSGGYGQWSAGYSDRGRRFTGSG